MDDQTPLAVSGSGNTSSHIAKVTIGGWPPRSYPEHTPSIDR